MTRVTITYTLSEIELVFSLVPFVLYAHRHHRDTPYAITFVYYETLRRTPGHFSGDALIFLRAFKERWHDTASIEEELRDLRPHFRSLVFFDDSDGSDSIHFEFFSLIDVCFKKQLPRDRQSLLRPLRGRHLFSDYYHGRGFVDDPASIRPPANSARDVGKLALAWNLGAGLYPAGGIVNRNRVYRLCRHFASRSQLPRIAHLYEYLWARQIRRLGDVVDLARRIPAIQARFSDAGYPNSIGAQRAIFGREAGKNAAFRTGWVDRKAYLRELHDLVGVLSPFGFGEICFRDFEAILSGALLLKPDCSHLETWPDLFRPGLYVPLDWMATDLQATGEAVLATPRRFNDIVNDVRSQYRSALVSLDARVEEVLRRSTATDV